MVSAHAAHVVCKVACPLRRRTKRVASSAPAIRPWCRRQRSAQKAGARLLSCLLLVLELEHCASTCSSSCSSAATLDQNCSRLRPSAVVSIQTRNGRTEYVVDARRRRDEACQAMQIGTGTARRMIAGAIPELPTSDEGLRERSSGFQGAADTRTSSSRQQRRWFWELGWLRSSPRESRINQCCH